MLGLINTRQDLADFCLRQLGGGVINIEISDEQINDNIDNAIQYYQEFHFDGIERDYLAKKLSATELGVADVTGLNVGDVIYNIDSTIYSTITEINVTTNKFKVARITGGVFDKPDVIHTSTVTKTITSATIGDVDNKYVEVDDTVVSVIRVLPFNKLFTSQEYMFDPKYQIMVAEMRNITSGGSSYLYSMMNYLGHLDFLLTKEKDFRFNRRMNRIYLDINWNTDLAIGDTVVFEVYKALDEDTYAEIMSDIWLKKYCTALFKKQWGSNLKKYQGMQLPGGVTYDGQQIYNEAIAELKDLEQQAIEQSAPLQFMIG